MAEVGQLRVPGPVDTLDTAFGLVRRLGLRAYLGGTAGAAALSLSVLVVYYLERVEGIRGARAPMAAALTLTWGYRALQLSALSRRAVLLLRPGLPLADAAGRTPGVLATAAVVGLGLWAWLWPMGGLVRLSPYALAALLPVLALRGAVAPSWIARAGCGFEGGFAAFGLSLDDTHGMRGVMVMVELLLLLGTALLFGNLYGLTSGLVLMAQSILGLDTAFVASFLDPDNGLVLLLVFSLTLCLIDPLRAAISAAAFVDSRTRRDGADLHAALDRAIDSARTRRGVGRAALLLACLVLPVTARAQTADALGPSAVGAQDEAVRAQVRHILSRGEFREFADAEHKGLAELVERFFKWLAAIFESDERDPLDRDLLNLPMPPAWLLISLAALALLGLGLYVTMQRPAASGPSASGSDGASAGPLDRAPASHLDEAERLAAAGEHRAALRALYLATLVALDREHLIRFEPSRTNWQYLRAMTRGERRELFASFTRTFDFKWYGHRPTSAQDYERCRLLATRICTPAGGA